MAEEGAAEDSEMAELQPSLIGGRVRVVHMHVTVECLLCTRSCSALPCPALLNRLVCLCWVSERDVVKPECGLASLWVYGYYGYIPQN